jgi:hypothetical protein
LAICGFADWQSANASDREMPSKFHRLAGCQPAKQQDAILRYRAGNQRHFENTP